MSEITQAKELASTLIEALAKTNDGTEWGSLSLNLTYNPKGEAPILLMAYLPGTTKQHAIAIQNRFAESVERLNDGGKK